MAQQDINIGAVANDGTGDPVRNAFDKCNGNFTELYSLSQKYRGTWDLSTNTYPGTGQGSGAAGALVAGDHWDGIGNGELNVEGLGPDTPVARGTQIRYIGGASGVPSSYIVIQP